MSGLQAQVYFNKGLLHCAVCTDSRYTWVCCLMANTWGLVRPCSTSDTWRGGLFQTGQDGVLLHLEELSLVHYDDGPAPVHQLRQWQLPAVGQDHWQAAGLDGWTLFNSTGAPLSSFIKFSDIWQPNLLPPNHSPSDLPPQDIDTFLYCHPDILTPLTFCHPDIFFVV